MVNGFLPALSAGRLRTQKDRDGIRSKSLGPEKSARRQSTRCPSGVKLTEAEDRWDREVPPRRVASAPQRCRRTAPVQIPSVQMAKWLLNPDGKRNHKLRRVDPVRELHSETCNIHRNEQPSEPTFRLSRPLKKTAQQRLAKI